MVSLIHPDGSPDENAIIREINRRCAEQEARIGRSNRIYHERHVAQEVGAQQWPLVEAEIARQWSPGERRAYNEALAKARGQSVDADGNKRFDDLMYLARSIIETVQGRAMAAFHRRIGQ